MIIFRVYCDLISIGILGTKEALPILGGLLTTMTNNPEDLSNVGIILTFCRYCGDEFANLIPRKVKLYLEAKPDPEFSETSKLLPLEKQKIVQVLLKDYYSNIVKKYHKDFNELKSTEKTNYRILMTKGEVFAERKKKVEEMNVTFKKLQTHVEQLSDLLDEDIPQLQEEEDNTAKGTFLKKKSLKTSSKYSSNKEPEIIKILKCFSLDERLPRTPTNIGS